MFGPYGDAQYPPGPELASMRGQMPVDPSGGPARYPFMPYYGKDGAQMAAAMAHRPPYAGEFGGVGNPEAMYNQGWNSMAPGQGYMALHAKQGPYAMPVCLHYYC